MGLVPEGQPKYNDLIDIIIQSAKKNIDIEQKDGTVLKDSIIDEEIVWWKTGNVNSNSFARFAFELKEWERQATEAFSHMTRDRARKVANQILDIGLSFRRSVDAKSSESLRDKNNSQSTLIDKINRNKIEKVYTQKGAMKKSVWDGIMGREAEKEGNDD